MGRAGAYARDKEWSGRELEESKLSIFQGIDAPRSVSSEASKEFMYGITEDMDQKMRENLLDVTKEDVQRVAQKYLVDLPSELKSVCTLGEKKDWIAKDPDHWHETKPAGECCIKCCILIPLQQRYPMYLSNALYPDYFRRLYSSLFWTARLEQNIRLRPQLCYGRRSQVTNALEHFTARDRRTCLNDFLSNSSPVDVC